MSIDVNAIEQTVVVTAVGDEVNVNIIDQPVLVSVTDQIIEVEASGATGPQGPAGAGVAAGGTTGQVLSKASNTNYDTVWVNAGAGTVYSVDASGSTGISVTGGPITGAGTLTITNTLPDRVVGLTGAGTAVITGTYPNFTITTNDEFDGTVTSVNLTAGTGISVSGGPITGSGSISVTNTAPDQVVSLTGGGTTTISGTYPNFTISSTDSKVGTVTSVDMTVPTGLTISGNPITSAGTLALALASGYSIPTTASQANWNTAYNDSITSASVSGTTTKTLTLNQQDGGTIQASWSDLNTDAVTSVFGRTGTIVATEGDYTLTQLGDVTLTSPTNGQVLKYNGTTWVNNTDTDTGLTSVGLSMPSAFAVSNSPLTSNGTIAVTGAGTSAQYVRGDGQLANFPSTSGGGSSVNYYLNGSVNQGTFGGDTYYEMSKSPIAGAGTNFTRTSAQGNGYIASFITDANDPSLLVIPGGNWNLEFYFNASSGGGTPSFYAELYKVSSSNVFTLIASGSTNPEGITQGTVIDQYFTSIPVPQTSLLATDRIAVRIFVAPDGRNITLHTEDNNLCEVLTTFSTGLNALNGLTAQVQYFATGSSGTDFAISSATDTHTFNLPIASGTNTGKLSNTDWTTFINKQSAITLTTFNASGSATFVSSVLNIPTYTLVGLGGEPAITPGASTQYFRGDKTFQTLDTSVVPENSNLYYTDTRARNAITLTTTGSSGASTYSGGTLNIPIYSLSGLGGVPTTRTLTINGTTYDLSADRSWSIPVHDAVTIGTANGLSLSTQVLSLGLSSSSANGALSSSDWITFNGKQNAITLTTTGSSGSATFISNTLNVPTYTLAGLGGQPQLNGTGFVKISGTTISYDNSTYYLASNPSAYIALTALTASAPLSYNNTTGAFTISQASGSVNGFLSSTDWTTFNNKQNTITNPVTGTGTTNYLPKWTSGSAIGNSLVYDDGTNVGIGNVSPGVILDIASSGTGIVRVKGGNSTNQGAAYYVGGNTVTLGAIGDRSAILGGTPEQSFSIYTGNVPLLFDVAATTKMTLTTSGNLLVNSSTDNGNRLQVTGNGYFSGDLGIGIVSPLTVTNYRSLDIRGTTGGLIEMGNTSNQITGRFIEIEATSSIAKFMAFNSVPLVLGTQGAERMRIDTSGNLGLGVQPSAWGFSGNIQLQDGRVIMSHGTYLHTTTNAFYDGTNWIYRTSAQTSRYSQEIGSHVWYIAPVGTAGNAITFTQAMTLTANGRLLLGTTTEGSSRLQVSGDAYINNVGGSVSGLTIYGNDQSNVRLKLQNANGRTWDLTGGLTGANNNDFTIYDVTASATRFQIASTGAATFSSSVTATQLDAYTSEGGSKIGATHGTGGTYPKASGISFGATSTSLSVSNNGGTTTFTGGAGIYANNSAASNNPTDLILWTTSGGVPAERMRITSGGNLLVGTTTDSGEKLQVNGSAKVTGKLIVNHSSTDYIAEFLNTSSANPYGVIIKDAASAANNYPLFHIVNNAASVEYFRVNSGTGTAVFSSTIQTGAPTGYSAQPWKLGDATSGTLTPNYYIKVEINGQIYSIPALQGTP